MCSSEIARVRAGGADYLEETSSVCVGEGCESERKRELETERERERGREGVRGVVCVHKWRIDRETMLMLFEIGLCTETQGKRVIVCVIGTS